MDNRATWGLRKKPAQVAVCEAKDLGFGETLGEERMEGSLVLIIILCSLFVLLTAFLLRSRLAEWCRGKHKTPKPKASISLAHRLSLSTHTLLSRCFQCWGTWVASWPLTILAVSVIVVVAMAGGLAFIELTTDPVELWSAPNSLARREKVWGTLESHCGDPGAPSCLPQSMDSVLR